MKMFSLFSANTNEKLGKTFQIVINRGRRGRPKLVHINVLNENNVWMFEAENLGV